MAIIAEDNKRQAEVPIACRDRVDNKYSSKHPNMILFTFIYYSEYNFVDKYLNYRHVKGIALEIEG